MPIASRQEAPDLEIYTSEGAQTEPASTISRREDSGLEISTGEALDTEHSYNSDEDTEYAIQLSILEDPNFKICE